MREFIPQIAVSLREDDTWEIDRHYAKNDKLGVTMWIANGYWFANIRMAKTRHSYGAWGDEVQFYLSLREKFVLWRAFKSMRKRVTQRAHAAVLEAIIQRRLTTK